jgi:chemotaxis protein methyltransferase CheR
MLRNQRLDSALWQSVISLLAIGETYFFRDDAQFRLLENDILPALIAQRRHQKNLHLALWSAGCATGEEPYSLAIVLQRLLPDIDQWNITLLATDLNQRALDVARRGIYRPWSFRLRHIDLSNAFQTVSDGLQIKPEIRRMVRFECGHLLDGSVSFNRASGPQPCFDIVFCRNVLLYFSNEQMRTAEQVLTRAVVPGGWLFLGHSETLGGGRGGGISPSEWERQPQVPAYHKLEATSIRDSSAPSPQRPDTPVLRPVIVPKPDTPILRPIDSAKLASKSENKDRYEQAVTAYRSYQLEAAEQLARDLIFTQPNHAKALLLLAYIAADRQDMAEASSYIERALRQDRLLADAYYLRSMIQHESGYTQQAEASLRAALYCQRDHALTLYSLGQTLADSGDSARATQLWQNLRLILQHRPAEAFVSDYSDLRVGRLRELLDE